MKRLTRKDGKYRKVYHTPSPELKALFTEEWSRANKILKPCLNGIGKPKLYVKKRTGTRKWAHCGGSKRTFAIPINNKYVRTQFVITFYPSGLERPVNDIRKTMQHEICHTVEMNHSSNFKSLLHQMQMDLPEDMRSTKTTIMKS